MNEKPIIVYKLICCHKGQLWSYNGGPGRSWSQQYFLRRWARPQKVKVSPLFAFRSLSAAIKWIGALSPDPNWEVFRAKATGVRAFPYPDSRFPNFQIRFTPAGMYENLSGVRKVWKSVNWKTDFSQNLDTAYKGQVLCERILLVDQVNFVTTYD